MRIHETVMPNGRVIRQSVRGVCKFDVLNPCWDNRPKDRVGHHWSSEPGDECLACEPCTALAKRERGIR
jgi:hypothetical protein